MTGDEAKKWLEERRGKLALSPCIYPGVYEIFEENDEGKLISTKHIYDGSLFDITEYLKD